VAEGRGDRVALSGDEGTTTYAELDLKVRRFAGALHEAGVHRGERVALILHDGALLSSTFWGTIALGAVVVPVNTLLTPAEHRAILEDCGARLVVVDPAISDREEVVPEGVEAWTAEAARARQEQAAPQAEYADTHRDGFCFFLYSSGTTGKPKGVVHLQHDMWVCCETYGRTVLKIQPDDRCFSMAKLFFAYGLGNSQYFPFHVGASAVLFAGRPKPAACFEQVARYRPTLFFGVPTGFANMLAAMDQGAEADFSSVRMCASAGEALPSSLFERWKERTGTSILDGIGSTELCHIFLSNKPGDIRPGASGTPVAGYDLRLLDDTGADVARGEMGNLLVRGDSTMALYWQKHEETKHALRGEWIRTGDRYVQDEDGYWYHAGRSDDMIKVGGIWVSPVEVEGVIIAHPRILEAAVVGHTDADGLVKPHAYVTLTPGAEADGIEDDLLAYCRERLARYKVPWTVTVLSELPKTATGKIRRFVLRGATG